MPYSDVADSLVFVIPALWFIGRQFVATRVTPRSLVAIPAILGLVSLHSSSSGTTTTLAAALTLGVNLGAGAVIGLWRGATFRLWIDSSGTTWQKGTVVTLASWLALIVVRGGSFAMGAPFAAWQFLLFFAVTLASQNLVIWVRSRGGLSALVAQLR